MNSVQPEHVLLTMFWHGRSAGGLGAKHVWAWSRSVRRLRNRGVEVTDPFDSGDEPVLRAGKRAFAAVL
ncbi:MAG TPA: hypothetical protein VEL10_11825 [Gaiellaceae bacterium]|nr:hypothetical protein [Gaiellaceae bacterium]